MMATTDPPTERNLSTAFPWSTQPVNGTAEIDPPSTLEDYHSGLIALTFLIIICNLFAIQTYKRHKIIHRNCSNALLLSLAISDLLVGVVYLPIVTYCENQWHKRWDNKTFVNICRVNYLFGNFSGFSTIFHVVALTLEKYVAVLHPLQRLSVSTTSTYRKILFTVWLLALVFAMAPLFWMFADNPWSHSWVNKFRVYDVVQAVVFLGLASVILMYCYIRMFFQIHVKISEHTAATGRVQTKARNYRKTVVIFLMFFTIFIAGWSPWFFFNLNHKHAELVSLEVRDFLVSLRFAGAVLNPLLYTFLKNDYKQAVHSDLRRLCASCPRPIAGLHELVQTNTLNTRRSTLTTATSGNDVKLKKIESPAREPDSSASAGL